jgi:hypothetical protein
MSAKYIKVTDVTGSPISTVHARIGQEGIPRVMRACARIRLKSEYPSHPSLLSMGQAFLRIWPMSPATIEHERRAPGVRPTPWRRTYAAAEGRLQI